MPTSSFDNLPKLSQREALKILATPIEKLELSSDYYKAVFHLLKYPGSQTEQALIKLAQSDSAEQAVVIARRKAVEGLARLKCVHAIPVITKCLPSNDPYLVENSVWALKELCCKDPEVHKTMISLLEDSTQNRRVIIQALSELSVIDALPKIRTLFNKRGISLGIRGASIVAISKFTRDKKILNELSSHLTVSNQNDRHCAVQDVIDSGDYQLLPHVLKAPVASSFRIRAVNSLWPIELNTINGIELLETIDKLIEDDPKNLNLIHKYDFIPDDNFLIEELFGTDFSRCYLALMTLSERDPKIIWQNIVNYLEKFRRDYGSLYFSFLLFRMVNGWNKDAIIQISELILSSLLGSWPAYMKFRPAGILALGYVDPDRFIRHLPLFLNCKSTPFWACRYAALKAIEHLLINNKLVYKSLLVDSLPDDPNRFVSLKFNDLEDRYI